MFWNWSRRRLGVDFAWGWRHDPDVPVDGPIVLFESPDGAEAHATWRLLQRQGYRTMWCPGPRGGFSGACALCEEGSCALVSQADAVVTALDLTDPRCVPVAQALNDVGADKPVVVVAPRPATAQWSARLPSCDVVAAPLRSTVLVRALSLALPAPAGRAPADCVPAPGPSTGA